MKNVIIIAIWGILFFFGEVTFGTDIDFNAVNPIGYIQSGDNYDIVTSHDSSIVTMTGGIAQIIRSYDSSTIQLQNGNIPELVSVYNSSVLSMSGGTIQYLEFHGGSAILTGGNINGYLGIFDYNSTVHIYGLNLNAAPYLGNPINGWLISGNWADNSQFSIYLRTGLHTPPSSSGPYVFLHEIPEPITISLLGFGIVIARRKR